LQTLLGFDFGLQRIGIAVGQSITRTATALSTIRSRDGRPDWDAISEMIRTWQPDALIIGLPRQADGEISDLARRIMRFARQLEGRYHLPVHTIDERLSSRAASALQNNGEEADDKGTDAVAARIILQDWLDIQCGKE
jgi:putative Holliday junction resolvase